MKIQTLVILLICLIGCEEPACNDNELKDLVEGDWKLVQKSKNGQIIPLSSCDSNSSRISVSHLFGEWSLCSQSGEIIEREIKFFLSGNDPDECYPNMYYKQVSEDEIFKVSGYYMGGIINIIYHNSPNTDTIINLRYKEL